MLSIVIPCYNEEAVVGTTINRLQETCGKLGDLSCEWIFVDDGSSDRTRQVLIDHATRESRVKVIGFTRNFGHQIAVSAGIDAASGDALVTLDADLQDPPEVIGQMIEKWREGYDVVYGVRTDRPGESLLKLTVAKWFYRIIDRVSDVPIPLDAGDFRLISRNVIRALRAMPERDRFLRGLVSWTGFKQIGIPYARSERTAGETKFTLAKLMRLASDGILSFCTAPLRILIVLGLLCVLTSIALALYGVFVWISTHTGVEGWTWVIIAVLLVGGIQLSSVGVLGEYVGRIYNETKRRPLYLIGERHGFGDRDPP